MKRITISIPDDVAAKADQAVAHGDAPSVSAWFSEVARREPNWSAAEDIIEEMIFDAGGLSEADREWADQQLKSDDVLGGAA